MSHTFNNIRVWQKSHSLVLEIYRVTENFPKSELYGITSQLRRSSASIAANITEGYKRKSNKDFSHFLNISDSSLEETKYFILLSLDLGYLNKLQYDNLIKASEEIGKMLFGFQRKLKS